jgi:hypothetical protein
MKICKILDRAMRNVIEEKKREEKHSNYLILLHGQQELEQQRHKIYFNLNDFISTLLYFFSVHKLRTVYKLPDGSQRAGEPIGEEKETPL